MFRIIGAYNGIRDLIDEFDTREEAEKMLAKYQHAFGESWTLYISSI